MRYLFFIVIFLLNEKILAENVKGIVSDGINRLFFLDDTDINTYDINSGKMLNKKNLKQDSLILNALYNTCIKKFAIVKSKVKEREALKIELQKLNYLNLSYHNQHLYIAFTYHLSNIDRKSWLGIIQLDSNLELKHHYLHIESRNRTYTLFSPYHAFEFDSLGNLLMMHYNQYDSLKFSYQSFTFNNKKNSISSLNSVYQPSKPNQHVSLYTNNQTVLSPIYYPVFHSNNQLFYQFPHPVIYSPKVEKYIDPYQIKPFIDSMDRLPAKACLSLQNGINFENIQNAFDKVVLTTFQNGDKVYLMVGKKSDNCVDMLVYNLKNAKSEKKSIQISLENSYFLFTNKLLVLLEFENGIPKISYMEL